MDQLEESVACGSSQIPQTRRPRGRPPSANPLSNKERQRIYRERARARRAAALESTGSIGLNPIRVDLGSGRDLMQKHWSSATLRFHKIFMRNEFGFACDVCDRLWFKNDLTKARESHMAVLENEFGSSCQSFMICRTCSKTLDSSKLPPNSRTNGFSYPAIPADLPPLDPIARRLISPRIPFMSIRRLRRDGGYGIVGQVINMPVDVNTMVRSLPRQLDDDYAINISIKRALFHKSSYLQGYVEKRVIKVWLLYLINQPLYKHYNITINPDYLSSHTSNNTQEEFDDARQDLIEDIETRDYRSEELIARQHTLLWNEEHLLEISPARGTRPLNLIFDEFAEELSFPQIYFGVGRFYKPGVQVTPYMVANSEIRRKDRRGTTPEHILYMAMKILRLRVVESIHKTFRCIRETENITRRMLQDRKFIEECVEKDFAFLKTIPNSMSYWQTRKKDLFALMRQLGKPTLFMTLSANEMNWLNLLSLLHKLRHNGQELDDENLNAMDRSTRADLINEDPVTCCLYFDKLVDVFMSMLKSKKTYNPFGKDRVVDFFLRIEFQHRGSPHAHILLWLETDPKEPISEQMPRTIQLINDLCSVDEKDLGSLYGNQVHKHTFTCTKRGELSCRFNIPYWPMAATRVLLPMAENHHERSFLKSKAKELRKLLETKYYESFEAFLIDNKLTEVAYLDIVRSTLTRPTVCFARDMSQLMTNTFHPWIGKTLNSNMDIQFILEEYSCASYVVEYVNKSNRGLSNLHRELNDLIEKYPDLTQTQLLRKLGAMVLNTVEMSAQEAAWYLLRLPMSHSSRDICYIPTSWPSERTKSYKTRKQLDASNIDLDSTDIWTKSIIQHYEDRPSDLDTVCLADFAAWYGVKSNPIENDQTTDERTTHVSRRQIYKKRKISRVIRYRHYESSDSNNFKREMVTLFVPFRNELVDVIDRNKYLLIYDEKLEEIGAKKREYESGLDITRILEQLGQVGSGKDDERIADIHMERNGFVRDILGDNVEENFDDFNERTVQTVSTVRTRPNVMPKIEYCKLLRTTNKRQREFIHEFINRLNLPNSQPIQVFFTGPAGCGKTYVLKLLMETINRYTQNHDIHKNAFVACASTGKAAVGLGGTTVHSVFHISQSRCQGPIRRETLHAYRQLFSNVRCIIVDEVSMISSDILHTVNQRLQQITGQLDETFGGMHIVFCGDFRQLPPVNACPVYKGSRNHLERAFLWQTLDFFPLHEVMRQSDQVFSVILTKIGEGEKLTGTESQLIESRFRTEQWCNENLREVVRLYHENHMVDQYNRISIVGGREIVALDTIIGYSDSSTLTSARAKLHRMSVMKTAGLPYSLLMAVGYPYMLTSNVDIDDGLVNGSLGILRFVEGISDVGEEIDLSCMKLWLEFPDINIGSIARSRLSVTGNSSSINPDWTPIQTKTATIKLTDSITCKRRQFPMTPACAITIHKSQGGTFDSAVVMYNRKQSSQLVYVGLSRVKSLDGLFLVNKDQDFTFYHKFGSNTPSIREIKDEYSRLNCHRLTTLTENLRGFLANRTVDTVIICTINAQSLVAHYEDIENDETISQSDIIAITESWMDPRAPVSIKGYELITSKNESFSCRPQESQNRTNDRCAGGVAIYRNTKSLVSCLPISYCIPESMLRQDSSCGDVSLVEVEVNGSYKFLLCAIYIHPRTTKTNIESLLRYALSIHSTSSSSGNLLREVQQDASMMVTGDFNLNVKNDKTIIEFMLNEFGFSFVPTRDPTTLRNTFIDLTFVRGLTATCKSFVAYFSDHRPLFTKISSCK